LPPAKPASKKRKGGEPDYDLRAQHYRILGVDLTQVPGISSLIVHTILTEVGPDFSKFRSASAFASWLGLCPDNDISGGKVLWVGTRKVNNRAAKAFRLAAHTVRDSRSALGDHYRRMQLCQSSIFTPLFLIGFCCVRRVVLLPSKRQSRKPEYYWRRTNQVTTAMPKSRE
jgi:hypothetical protein